MDEAETKTRTRFNDAIEAAAEALVKAGTTAPETDPGYITALTDLGRAWMTLAELLAKHHLR